MPRTSSVHGVTTIGMDMGKNTLHMIGLDSRGAVLRQRRQPLRSFGHSPRAQPPRLPVIGFPAARRTGYAIICSRSAHCAAAPLARSDEPP
jgi:hypothetical protein